MVSSLSQHKVKVQVQLAPETRILTELSEVGGERGNFPKTWTLSTPSSLHTSRVTASPSLIHIPTVQNTEAVTHLTPPPGKMLSRKTLSRKVPEQRATGTDYAGFSSGRGKKGGRSSSLPGHPTRKRTSPLRPHRRPTSSVASTAI